MKKYSSSTRFSKNVFKICDAIIIPFSNWAMADKRGVIVCKNVPYGEGDDRVGDIYYLKELEGKKKPVFLEIHGGGFVGGDKSVRDGVSVWYARMGFFVYSINYALAPERPFPEANVDCIVAYNWLVDNAESYNLDISRIVVGGDSTGGYLTSAVATASYDASLKQYYGVAPKVKPRAICLNSGVYDIEPVLKNKMIFDMAGKIAFDLFGVPISELNSYPHRRYLSTFDFVSSEFPPTFMAYAKKDAFVPGQGERMLNKLLSCGVKVTSYEGKRRGDNHSFPLFWDLKSSKEANALLEEYLKEIVNESKI